MKLWLTSFLVFTTPIWAEMDEVPMPPDQSFWQTLIMIGVALVFFYLVLWRPEQKRRKAQEEQRQSLKKGDRVAAMGIIGHVVRVGDQTVILRMFDGAKLEFYKAAISDILPPSEDTSKQLDG